MLHSKPGTMHFHFVPRNVSSPCATTAAPCIREACSCMHHDNGQVKALKAQALPQSVCLDLHSTQHPKLRFRGAVHTSSKIEGRLPNCQDKCKMMTSIKNQARFHPLLAASIAQGGLATQCCMNVIDNKSWQSSQHLCLEMWHTHKSIKQLQMGI
jgi:hypothetical protein